MAQTDAPHAERPLELQLRVISGLGEVSAAAWDACAGADHVSDEVARAKSEASSDGSICAANPLVSHAFLSALEQSGSATPRTGWAPQHLLAETADGELLGAVPCYLKS